MRSPSAEFTYEPASEVSRARRVLIKPSAPFPLPYPVSTNKDILAAIIRGVRRISEADIILLEGPSEEEHTRTIFRALGYDFPRVLSLDVRDCTLVEVENPLPKPYAMGNFWVPNVLLSCDYLMSVTPCTILSGRGALSVPNLLGLLPKSKYGQEFNRSRPATGRIDVQGAIADLYFTVPFDLGIVDAKVRFDANGLGTEGTEDQAGTVFSGEPYDVDLETAETLGIDAPYLRLIANARVELESPPDSP
ncbi:MAG: DUF362 domain-containing protein [Dehalococcoidia bacterium]|nr:DUF362 domain-containing protein [Dehalococcoidia bacterium]